MQNVWERERREKGNALTVFLATWVRVHKPKDVQAESEKKNRESPSASAMDEDQPALVLASLEEGASSGSSTKEHSDREEESSAESARLDSTSNEEDVVEDLMDLMFSSDESD